MQITTIIGLGFVVAIIFAAVFGMVDSTASGLAVDLQSYNQQLVDALAASDR